MTTLDFDINYKALMNVRINEAGRPWIYQFMGIKLNRAHFWDFYLHGAIKSYFPPISQMSTNFIS